MSKKVIYTDPDFPMDNDNLFVSHQLYVSTEHFDAENEGMAAITMLDPKFDKDD